ncbi:hypothetical protein ASC97_00335 [Rhizobium sp. Root1203]|uniref:hypothetical protein n=1 Tax=Rhizobium sp. Root1203 TaxID=1736427 RepID=UPI0007100423|nr:hypothetical protein [Rhizobium sp. Root1203]KQV32088.1 hypothetical protein ASC97_00335 [Rhizobium sp. Root1203]
MGQNEAKRHFELRNLDKDMRKAAEDAAYVVTKERAKAMRIENRGMLVFLILLVGLVCCLLGAF